MGEANTALDRALRSLDGLSVGDAFGERFFLPGEEVHRRARERRLPEPPWRWTDDTQMAVSIVAALARLALGDRDTTCAIVGGILAMTCEVPAAWLANREPLPA